MATREIMVRIQRMDILVRWESVNSPFEQWLLLSHLPEHGFVVSDELADPPRFGGRVEGSGVVARKGDTYLTIDSQRPGMGIGGNSPIDVLTEFETLEKIMLESLSFDSNLNARFYEVDVQAIVESSDSPLAAMRRSGSTDAITNTLKGIIDPDLARFGVRWSSSERIPGSKNWHEIFIEPAVRQPENYYSVALVFRREEWEPVREISLNVENKIRNSCMAISEGH